MKKYRIRNYFLLKREWKIFKIHYVMWKLRINIIDAVALLRHEGWDEAMAVAQWINHSMD